MPKFIDFHESLPELPQEAIDQMSAKIKGGQPDSFGVITHNVFLADGKGWCYNEGPSASAVCESHRAAGFVQDEGNVSEVMSFA